MEDTAQSEPSKTAHPLPNAATAGDSTTCHTSAKRRRDAVFAAAYMTRVTTPTQTPLTAPNADTSLRWATRWTPPTKANARMTKGATTV